MEGGRKAEKPRRKETQDTEMLTARASRDPGTCGRNGKRLWGAEEVQSPLEERAEEGSLGSDPGSVPPHLPGGQPEGLCGRRPFCEEGWGMRLGGPAAPLPTVPTPSLFLCSLSLGS